MIVMKKWEKRPPPHLPAEDRYPAQTSLMSEKCRIQNTSEQLDTEMQDSFEISHINYLFIYQWTISIFHRSRHLKVRSFMCYESPITSTALKSWATSVHICFQSLASCWEESLNFTMAICAPALDLSNPVVGQYFYEYMFYKISASDSIRLSKTSFGWYNVKLTNNDDISCRSQLPPFPKQVLTYAAGRKDMPIFFSPHLMWS